MAESVRAKKGRVKEGLGKVTADKDLEREGKVEQGAEKLKGGVDKVTKKAKNLLNRDKH